MPSGYLSASGIESCLVYLANTYPSLCQLIVLPETSAEGRTMRALKLGKGSGEGRHGVLLVGGLHARELVNPDALVALALRLCQAYTGNTSIVFGGKTFESGTVKLLVEALDIYFFPLVNPDGRSYVQAPSGDAWWRKNRRPIPGSSCVGVDLNRNFDFLWSSGIGTSPDPCNYQTYKGTAPFSESETRNVRWLVEHYPVKCFMDVHSYSELILYPWGDDVNQTTDSNMNFRNSAYDGLRGNPSDSIYKEYIPGNDSNSFVNTGVRLRDAIAAVRGRSYTLEQSVGLYPTSGTSDDYMYSRFFAMNGTRKVRGYTIETGTEFQPAFPEAWNVMQEAMSGALEFCVACICVVEEISQGHRLADYLDNIRYLRDDILLEHPIGKKYVELLNQHTLELLLHTTESKELLEVAQTLLTEVTDVALSERGVFEGALISKMQKAMGLFSRKASPELKRSLKELQGDLEVFKGKTLRGGLKAVIDKPTPQPRPKRKRKVRAKPSKRR